MLLAEVCGSFGVASLLMLIFLGAGIAKLGKAVAGNPEGSLRMGSILMSMFRRR